VRLLGDTMLHRVLLLVLVAAANAVPNSTNATANGTAPSSTNATVPNATNASAPRATNVSVLPPVVPVCVSPAQPALLVSFGAFALGFAAVCFALSRYQPPMAAGEVELAAGTLHLSTAASSLLPFAQVAALALSCRGFGWPAAAAPPTQWLAAVVFFEFGAAYTGPCAAERFLYELAALPAVCALLWALIWALKCCTRDGRCVDYFRIRTVDVNSFRKNLSKDSCCSFPAAHKTGRTPATGRATRWRRRTACCSWRWRCRRCAGQCCR